MITGCGFGGRVKAGKLTEFERKYFQHQADFAYEELGDQIDNDVTLIERYGNAEAMLTGYDFVEGLAQSIRYCLTNRYLGNCFEKCRFKRPVDEYISLEISTREA